MKYKFTIFSPHPDDEFIGCRQFIKTYADCIDNIVFLTNGERSVTCLPDLIEYATRRRLESEKWIYDNIPHLSKHGLHYLNIPDGMNMTEIGTMYGSDIFEKLHNKTVLQYTADKLRHIVGDTIILAPNTCTHPTHILCSTLADYLDNPKIYYSVHETLKEKVEAVPGVYINKVKTIKAKFLDYLYVLADRELFLKRKEFKQGYRSQYEDFLRTGLIINNWERYLSPIPIKLCSEDKMFKQTSEMRA